MGRIPASVWLALGAFAVYALGACPTIYVGDSGELVAAVHVLGIPHPSGYPLYVLLGKLWTLLVPLGSVAYRMSLFSVACGAAAVGVLHRTARAAGLGPVPATFAALLFAFSPSHWGEANVQRVYALNALFVALATASGLAWHRTRRDRLFVATAFLCGLGASNHTYMGVFGIAFGLFAAIAEPALLRRVRTLALAAAAGLAGLVPYAFLLLRSRADPPLDWSNPETLAGLWTVVTRRDFWMRRYYESPADLAPIGLDYLRGLGQELLGLGAALAIVGVVAGRRRFSVVLPLFAMLGNLAVMAFHGSRSDLFLWHRYYIPSYLLAALLAGIGAQLLLERMPRLKWLPLALPALALATGWRDADRSRFQVAEAYSRQLLDTLPPGAHLAASDDNILFVLIYLRLVEGLRPDLDLIMQGVGDADLPPLRFNPDDDPLFFTHHPNWNTPGIEVAPVGLVFRTVRTGRPLPEPAALPDELQGESDPRVPKDYLTRNLLGEYHYMKGVTAEARDFRTAWREFERAGSLAPENDVLFYNLGLIFARNGLFDESLAAFRRSHAINPRPVASVKRVRASDKVEETEARIARVRALEASLGQGIAAPSRSPAWHAALAERLEAAGHALEARGHRLRAALAQSGA